jgi:hypothetical protein
MIRRLPPALVAALLAAACAPLPPAGVDAPVAAAVNRSCRAAIAQRAGVPVAAVTMLELNAGGTGIEARATVDGARAPWACFADRAGAVRGVSYTGAYP